MDEKHKKRRSILLVLAAVAAITAGAWVLTKPILALANDPAAARSWIEGLGIWGPLAYLALVVLQIVVAVIPGEPLELGAGYAFGFWRGTLLCEIGILLGGLLVFLFVKRFGVKAVEVFFPREKIESLRFLHNEKRLALWVFILFFIPGTPKDIMTYIVPLTPMKLSTFLLLSTVARLPSVITSTIGGNALGTGKLTFALIVFGATALISALGILIYRRICKRSEGRQKEDQA